MKPGIRLTESDHEISLLNQGGYVYGKWNLYNYSKATP
jgi:hypothetical protein